MTREISPDKGSISFATRLGKLFQMLMRLQLSTQQPTWSSALCRALDTWWMGMAIQRVPLIPTAQQY
ncbi:hypothetical protein BDZ91DRAFT_728003 [Kalaharituber pfeilii]|nr:hypothetical protein BDZ91DRAFT_728003 [Kalaharituber pfeilii]